MRDIQCRPYIAADLAACLAIFDSNLPRFFAPEERSEFQDFLRAPSGPYLVLLDQAEVLACGGLSLGPDGGAGLAWGMVARARHGQGLGRQLTLARLDLARQMPGLSQITLSTSQHTRGFYEGFGFIVSQITPDGYGPGLDRCDMVLRL